MWFEKGPDKKMTLFDTVYVEDHGSIWMAFFASTSCLGGHLSHGAIYHFCLFNKPVVAIQTI